MKTHHLLIVLIALATTALAGSATLGDAPACAGKAMAFDAALGLTAPEVVYKESPQYPEEVRKEGAGGLVILEVVIDRTGTVDDVSVAEDPDPRLTAAAVKAVRNWRFRPARTADGEAVDVCYVLTVKFALE